MKTFVTIWTYEVKQGKEIQFEELYGNDGAWVKLFRKYPDYLKTELHKDLIIPSRYVTIDYWKSREAYDVFRKSEIKTFEEIDKTGEELTGSEIKIGEFLFIE
jgi:heme-degrading monooxygenase HmoA